MQRLIIYLTLILILFNCKSKGLYLYEFNGIHYSILNIDGNPKKIYIDSIFKYKESELDSFMYCFYLNKCQQEDTKFIEIYKDDIILEGFTLSSKKNEILYKYEFTYFDNQLNIKSKKNKDSDLKIISLKFIYE